MWIVVLGFTAGLCFEVCGVWLLVVVSSEMVVGDWLGVGFVVEYVSAVSSFGVWLMAFGILCLMVGGDHVRSAFERYVLYGWFWLLVSGPWFCNGFVCFGVLVLLCECVWLHGALVLPCAGSRFLVFDLGLWSMTCGCWLLAFRFEVVVRWCWCLVSGVLCWCLAFGCLPFGLSWLLLD